MIKKLSYSLLILKRKAENIFLWPFIMLGRFIAWMKPLPEQYDIFLFFPFYHTGGAEKYNLAVAHALKGKKVLVVFTRKSVNETFLEGFKATGHRLWDISSYTDNKWLYFLNCIYRGILTGYINKHKGRKVVFNGQCNFAYKISPWVRKDITQLEFIHTFCTFSYIRPPFLQYYTHTISSSKKTINDHLAYYRESKVPDSYGDRFLYILYGIPMPEKKQRDDFGASPFRVLFVGRGTPEKRVHIVAAMAKQAKEEGLPVEFVFMGDVEEAIPADLRHYCILLGNKSDVKEIQAIYRSCHLLVISSAFEGFPFVVMEAMSHGLPILSTPVGDVPVHVQNDDNGFIIPELDDERVIVKYGVAYISTLCNDRQLAARISVTNQEYAYAKFAIDVFDVNYKKLFESFL